MLRSAIAALASALSGGTGAPIPYEKNKARQLSCLSSFLRPFGGEVTPVPESGTVSVSPVTRLCPKKAVVASCPDPEVFWLLAGAAARMDLVCFFTDVPASVPDDLLETAVAASAGTVRLLRKGSTVALSSMLGAGKTDKNARLPSPFLAGLLLGAVLGRADLITQPGVKNTSKAEVSRALEALKACGADVRVPGGGVVVIRTRRGRDFSAETGELLKTPAEREENRALLRERRAEKKRAENELFSRETKRIVERLTLDFEESALLLEAGKVFEAGEIAAFLRGGDERKER